VSQWRIDRFARVELHRLLAPVKPLSS
jgi:hypothetical protein